MIERYLKGRERVIGSLKVSRDPAATAEMLAEQLGGTELARRWLLAAVEAIPERRVWVATYEEVYGAPPLVDDPEGDEWDLE